MITPSYSLTATERVLPKLALDFTTASLDPRVTFTRTAATATRVNSNGLIEVVAANTPRFDYSPVTLVCQGLLIEESRSNLLAYGNVFSQINVWASTSPIVDNFATSPDGTQNAAKFAFANTSGYAFQQISGYVSTVGATITASIYVNTNTRVLYYGGGTIAGTDVYSSVNAGNGWYRQILTRTFTTATTGNIQYLFSAANIGTTPFYAFNAQLEAGAFATSVIYTGWKTSSSTSNAISNGSKTFTVGYNATTLNQAIPSGAAFIIGQTSNTANYLVGTVTSHVGTTLTVNVTSNSGSGSGITDWTVVCSLPQTRNADEASMTGTNFTDWWNSTQNTIEFQYLTNLSGTATGNRYIGCVAKDASNFIEIAGKNTNGKTVVYQNIAGSFDVSMTGATSIFTNTYNKLIVAMQANNYGFALNSTSQGTDTSCSLLSSPTSFEIGRWKEAASTGGYFCGWVQKINAYPQRLTASELSAFTAG